ncbi:MAG: histidinol-phosphatase [Pirellulaceae bacterium]|nr:histidinol-phosphatase [Pirellulaceae bacterium]MCU0978054.1 histidinol-phosphatase [Pirellulaceae bacterium]
MGSEATPELASRLDLAVGAAREAGQLTLGFFQREDLAVQRKADNSPVTAADRQAEQLLRRRIREAFPDDGILGEEFGEEAGTSGFRWILDPIDGTKSFICGVPLYGTLIGVERAGASVVGVIYIPGLDECVYAAIGGGAWYTHGQAAPRPARVSQRDRLADAVFLTSQLDTFYLRGAQQVYLDLERAASITRTWGDCYGYLLVATGRADVMVDPVMNVWDAAALQPILEEAGGVYTDWSGRPTIHAGEGIGCNRTLLDQVLAITRRHIAGAGLNKA